MNVREYLVAVTITSIVVFTVLAIGELLGYK